MELTIKDMLILMKEIMERMMMVKNEMMMLMMMKEIMEVMKKKKKMMIKMEMMMMQVMIDISWSCFRGSAPTFALRRCSVWTDGFVRVFMYWASSILVVSICVEVYRMI
ncbi:hypothetical protein GUITHDRAFT_103491 [Guillardia theta CCMP2712]|uniref:Uncharacterized protein n=1 Tax=Guillardia theta (strain CCMP2712) TaxID=905079 RepID=L1JR43_GUITC|nr:hypothetical protein GUITHDRAFT_103491 [Guillardia theta CCMP2712]EKX50907.1 hypothetical protein GUITHDRAFT_103491 [Guillardia theta CCMP2712]|eukprot:XP_005837887.1 hypothetical protein GUITHDRAFT_103491 [Guillardia theta CCMP2712]